MDYWAFLITTILIISHHSTSTAHVSCPASCQSCDNDRVICSAAGLTAVPTELPEETLSMDFTQNNIQKLDGLPNLPNAQSLRLSMNQLTVITGGLFKPVPLLMSLDLSLNKITKVYAKGFEGLDQLMTISLNGNKITTIAGMFQPITDITSVRLGNNEITTIEEGDFEKNTKIKMLDLSHNKIKSIHPNAFKNLEMLRYLILSNNPLITATDLTFTSKILSLADFTSCMLTSVPRTMPPSLTDYRLGNNKITKILKQDFENITSLRIIFLNDNQISDVEHRSFGSLDNLKELWLSRNQLVYVPRGLPKNLEKLHIDNNHVVELEPMLFTNGSKLMKLSLESNDVRKIHQDSLKEVNDLDELNIQGNRISLIDVGTFTKVPNLKILKLTNNPIQIFENGAFQNLDSLSEIYLAHLEPPQTNKNDIVEENFFVSMPNLTTIDLTGSALLTKQLFKLLEEDNTPMREKVKTITLQYNDLDTVPISLKFVFPNVESVILDGNPFTCDKRLVWLHDWMGSSTVKFNQNEQLVCEQPHSLQGRALSELQADEFVEVVKPGTTEQAEVQTEEQQATFNVEDKSTDVSSAHQVSTNTQTQSSQVSNNKHSDVSRQSEPPRQPSKTRPPSNSQPTTQSRPPSSHYGLRVVIKPPSGSSRSPASQPNTNNYNKKKLDKAARKAARQAERARKRRLKEERKRGKKKRQNRDKNKKRRKRRIRRKDGKRCQVDQNGEMQCSRRKRCKVDEQGNVVCRKRKNKKDRKTEKKGKNTAEN